MRKVLFLAILLCSTFSFAAPRKVLDAPFAGFKTGGYIRPWTSAWTPWALNPNAIADGRETWVTDFAANVRASGTVSLGGRSFTQDGNIYRTYTSSTGNYYNFAGANGDALYTGDAFLPAGSFSVVLVLTPSQTAMSAYVVSKGTTWGTLGWYLHQNKTSYEFGVSSDGMVDEQVSKVAITANKTSLVTLTYEYVSDGTSVAKIYVDDLTVATANDMYGPVFDPLAYFVIGGDEDRNSTFQGKIYHVAYYDGVVLSANDHASMYDQFKMGGILPLYIGNSAEQKKIRIAFDARCEYPSKTRSLLTIGGNTSDATYTRNRIYIDVSGTGALSVGLHDDSSTAHTMVTRAYTDWNAWHTYAVYFDLSDLSKSYVRRDGAAQTTIKTAMSGTGDFSSRNCLIRPGQDYLGNSSAECEFENLKMWVED